VVAVLCADQLGGEPNPRAAQIVLAHMVKIQKPSSYYATTVVREAGRPRVHLAFEGQGRCPKICYYCGGKTVKHPPRLGNRMDTSVGQRDGIGIGSYAAAAKGKAPALRPGQVVPWEF
jgi:hypothetical protein